MAWSEFCVNPHTQAGPAQGRGAGYLYNNGIPWGHDVCTPAPQTSWSGTRLVGRGGGHRSAPEMMQGGRDGTTVL
eukprot:4365360-Pyramimonas_sp.AAC.1